VSLRFTTRPMTGRPCPEIAVAWGYGPEGRPAVTLHPYGREHVPLTDPRVVRGLIDDLQAGLAHLEGRA
jgi:hypothetical protein